MKFRKYHPTFVELSDEEEKEYEKWRDVNGVADCMRVLFPSGPYETFHDGMPEEKVICVASGHKYFIETSCPESDWYVLMDYAPDGQWWVLGLTDCADGKTVEWDEDKEEWRITDGLPEKRY